MSRGLGDVYKRQEGVELANGDIIYAGLDETGFTSSSRLLKSKLTATANAAM